MPLPRRRRVAAGLLAAFVIDAGFAAISSLPAAAARSAATAGAAVAQKAKAVATLAILKPGVSVRRKGKDEFKPATDGQNLRVGDTVQTDAAGFVQINYTDDSFTRLDVDTTFTIVSLTDDEGNRQIEGSLETGRTWNRTSALTESESFEQEGAGATAAVVGTAFVLSCTSPGNCTLTSVVHGTQYTTVDGELQLLDPFEECVAIEGDETDLCDVPTQLTIDAILANDWIMLNLFLDGLLGLEGIIIVEDGVVVSFTPVETNTGSDQNQTPAAAAPPAIDQANPVLVEDCSFAHPNGFCAFGDLVAQDLAFPAPGLFSDEGSDVLFKINSSAGPDALPYFIFFTVLPDAESFGFLTFDDGTLAEELRAAITQPVVVDTPYAHTTVFTFHAVTTESGTDSSTTVHVENADGGAASVDTPIPITVDYPNCG